MSRMNQLLLIGALNRCTRSRNGTLVLGLTSASTPAAAVPGVHHDDQVVPVFDLRVQGLLVRVALGM